MADTADPSKKPKLPPGMVLGPDGKPCKVCTAFRAVVGPGGARKTGQRSSTSSSDASTSSSTSTAATSLGVGSLAAAAVARDDSGLRKDCPADVERLGRHTWTFLHTTAAYYPSAPSPAQRTSMLSLLSALPTLYPCTHCASDLALDMQKKPPVVDSREGLERWLCEMHNGVNRKLGKEVFDCRLVGERWRDGWKDGRCEE